LSSYGRMIECEPRMGAFAAAMRHAITPGCRVLEIGTGPGIMAIMACQMGAGHVVAIEPDPSIELARRLAAANGCADRITFVRDLSTNWQPDALADVVVSDIRGVMPLFEHHIPCIIDARSRLLKPGGVQIPGVDRIYAALVEAPQEHAKYAGPWRDLPYGVDMALVHPFTINTWGRTWLGADAVLSDTALFATLDYRTITDPNARAEMHVTTTRPGTVHGILMWSETELAPGIGHSNAPEEPEQVYGQAFFPLEQPVMLAEGARAQVTMAANFIDGDYVWSWSFAATDTAGPRPCLQAVLVQGAGSFRLPPLPRARRAIPAQARDVSRQSSMPCLVALTGRPTLRRSPPTLRAEFPGTVRRCPSAALDHVANLSAICQPETTRM
jgi:type I protein arginine methyltransferase